MKAISWIVMAIAMSGVAVGQTQSFSFEGRTYYVPLSLEFGFADGLFRYVNYFETEGHDTPERYPSTMSGPYEILDIEGFTVARVQFPMGPRDLFLFYEGRQLIVYDTELEVSYWGSEFKGDGYGLFPVTSVEASSFFTEVLNGKEVRYVAENLRDFSLTNPWVEGVPGLGHGEQIRIATFDGDHVVLLNGFFAPQQPTLYRDNGRLKRVLVRGFDAAGDLLFAEFYGIPDAPNLHVIQFPTIVSSFEIEIVEAYPGRRFEDTAVSGVFVDAWRLREALRRDLGQ